MHRPIIFSGLGSPATGRSIVALFSNSGTHSNVGEHLCYITKLNVSYITVTIVVIDDNTFLVTLITRQQTLKLLYRYCSAFLLHSVQYSINWGRILYDCIEM